MAKKFSSELLDILFALILFLAGLGYSVSGLPANIVVGCVIWAFAWAFLVHLFFITEWTKTCPQDVKVVVSASGTFFVILLLWTPVKSEYAKEHYVQPDILEVEVRADTRDMSKVGTGLITWNQNHIHIELLLSDDDKTLDIDNFDMTLNFDTWIAAIAQVSNFPCIAFPALTKPLTVGVVEEGHKELEAIIPTGPTPIVAQLYRIHCDKIIKGTTVNYQIAGANMDSLPNGASFQPLTTLLGPRRLPKYMDLTVSYYVNDRNVKKNSRINIGPYLMPDESQPK